MERFRAESSPHMPLFRRARSSVARGLGEERMSSAPAASANGTREQRSLLKWIAGGAAAALVAGILVVAGVGAQQALAAGPAPEVSVTAGDVYIAGEDLAVSIKVTSNPAAGSEFNLSAGVVLPKDVTLRDSGALGTPTIYPEGTVLSGAYTGFSGTCTALGLVNSPNWSSSNNECQVAPGTQYLVFQNISDLPENASVTHTLTVRPNAGVFPVGSTIDVIATAYTSNVERYIPVFPGSTGVAAGDGDTSGPGTAALEVPVKALRITKSEPSDENELLRGVHDHTTTYTLRVYHTGEGDLTGVEVVDFLPAGLEYLGVGGAENGSGDPEYTGAASLTATPAPNGDDRAWGSGEKSVTTVIPTAEEVAQYGLETGKVYTRVVWDLGTLLATTDARDMATGVEQEYADTAGKAGYLELHYRAGIPLFENTMDFGGATPSATTGEQGSNLDNNNGASTRHGNDSTGAPAQTLINRAGASGNYGDDEVTDTTEYSVDAVDVRVLKTSDTTTFTQGQNARFTLDIATSEYVTAQQGASAPDSLTDVMGDGICPIFPAGTPTVSGGATFTIGGSPAATIADWNTALTGDYGASGDCTFPSAKADATDDALTGASLASIDFDPASGKFTIRLALDAASQTTLGSEPSQQVFVEYSATQKAAYAGDLGEHGATTSGDTISNQVDLTFTTTPRSETAGMAGIGDDFHAWDDSASSLATDLTKLAKTVLKRSAGVPDADEIAEQAENNWVKTPEENDPFTIGDEVWYRVVITPPTGSDVRNPMFTDFLPAGVTWDPTIDPDTNRPEDMWIVPATARGIGQCQPDNAAEWLDEFAPFDVDEDYDADGGILTFRLGSSDCFPNSSNEDRFLPLDTTLEIYLKVTVTDLSAFGSVDLPQNLAKYQQNNVDGDVFFLRDEAEIELDQSSRLVKGIRSINGEPGAPAAPYGNGYLSDVDHQRVVQGDEVTFRLDVTGSYVDGTNYQIWDALPVGVKKADIKDVQTDGTVGSANAVKATQEWVVVTDPGAAGYPGYWGVTETSIPSGWTATVYDFDDIPAAIADDLRQSVKDDERSVIVWTLGNTVTVPASIPADDDADPDAPETQGAPQGVSLSYTVVVPDGSDANGGPAALLEQSYANDAAIVQYSAINNTPGATTPLVPEGSNDPKSISVREADDVPGGVAVDQRGTFDDSDVFLPGADIEKSLVSTEIPGGTDAQNTDSVIVQGETATFDYSVELPANTTVRGGVLADLRNFVGQGSGSISPSNTFAYKLKSASVQSSPAGITVTDVTGSDPVASSDPLTFGFRTDTGKLVFPEFYTTGDADETFTIRIVVWTSDVDATNTTASATRPNIPNNKDLRNTAVFDSMAFDGSPNDRIDDTADVTYREPNLSIAKVATPDAEVAVGDEVTYRIAVTNNGRVKSYDNTVVDTVPAGLHIVAGSFRVGTGTNYNSATVITDGAAGEARYNSSLNSGTGGQITWSHERTTALEDVPTTVYLFYRATIDPTSGAGQTYRNDVNVAGYTLPADLAADASTRRGDRTRAANETITAITADISKGVRVKPATGDPAYTPTASAPIGETVQYRVDVTLNANVNYYDAKLQDTLPQSLSIVPGTAKIWLATGSGSAVDVTSDWTPATSGQTTSWTYNGPGGDIIAGTVDRTLSITYDVLLADDDVAGNVNSLENTAGFAWATSDGGTLRDPIEDDATVNVLNPDLRIVKKVDGVDEQSYDPDESFDYTLAVSQTAAGNTAAHHITVVDDVPDDVIVDPATITPVQGVAGVLTGTNVDGSGGTITWSDIPGPLYPQTGTETPKSIELGYTAKFSPSTSLESNTNGVGLWLENTASVTHFESFGTDGRKYNPTNVQDDAQVRPMFPRVTLEKTVADTSHTAYVGEPFEWILTATNSGAGDAQKVVMTDTLPANWTFDEVKSITVAGDTVALTDPSASPTGVPNGPLVWTFGSDAAADGTPAAILPAGENIVIRFTAIPTNPDALTTPGVGSQNPHTNQLSAVTTDRTNANSNQTRSHTGDPASDDAFLREADLELVKTAIGGVTDTVPASHPLSGVPEGSWVIGQAVESGVYTQPQWRITVTNHGPDDGYGQFTIVDTPTLPSGVTVGNWTAQYFAAGSSTGTALSVDASTPGVLKVGTNSTHLNAAGTDRIVLTANVTIADTTAPGAEISNFARVDGRTYEAPENKDPAEDPANPNEDTVEKTVTESADLEVVKTVSGTVNAGETINWSIQPINHGPSVSRNTAADPITITDTVPEGVRGLADPSNTTWLASLNGAAWPNGTLAEADDVITFTLSPSVTSLAVGGAGVHGAITLSGTVDADWTPTSGPESDGSIVNTATIAPELTPDPKTPNNTDDAGITPTFNTSLGIAKILVVWDDDAEAWVSAASVPDYEVLAGDPVSYLVTVSNNGNAEARGVKVVDERPSYLSNPDHQSVDGATGEPAPGVTWTRTTGGTNAAGTTNANWDTFALTGNLPVGEVRSFVVTYDTSPASPESVVNWVEASSSDNENHPRDDEGFDSDRSADLSIKKSHTVPAADTAVKAGETVTYRLVVTNEGPSDAVGPIDVTDTLPAQFSYVAGSTTIGGVAAANPTVTGQLLEWEVLPTAGTLPVASGSNTIVVEFQARVSAEHPEADGVVNRATVDGPHDEDPSNDTSSDEVDVVTEATMTIDKAVTSPAAAPWYAGTDVTYTLTVTNNGPSVAPAHVVDTLPDGLTMVSMSGTDWDCTVTPGTQTGACEYDGLHPVGASAATTITVVAHIDSNLPTTTLTNPFVNDADLTWTDSRTYDDPADDPRHDDGDASITVTTQADLGLVKTAVDPENNETEVDTAVAGEQARYRIDVTNYGPSDAAPDMVVTDTLPLGVRYVGPVGTTSDNWDISATDYDPTVAQVLTFTRVAGGENVGLPMVGTSATAAPVILIDVELEPGLAAGDTLVNVADVTSGTPEPSTDPHPNDDDAPLDVTRSADLSVVKTHPSDLNGQVHVGDPLDFTIEVANAGPSEASGITITDTIPAGLEVTSVTGPVAGTAWTIDSITLLDPLDPTGGATVVASYADALGVVSGVDAEAEPLVISTIIHENAHGTDPNHVSVAGDEPDPSPGNNEWDDPLDVNALVTLLVEKQAVGKFQVGKTGTYRITVTNQGPHADPGPITVTDVLPQGLAYSDSPSLPAGATVAVNGKTVTWTLPNGLGVDETQTLTLVVQVQQAAYPEVTNVVTVETPSDLTPDSVISDDETVPVAALDPLSITGGAAVGYLAMLAALLMLVGAALAARRRNGARAVE